MSHEVETMAYANQTPWHGLGFQVADTLSVEEMLKAAKLDWSVSKRPIYYGGVNGHRKIGNEFALVRDSDETYLDLVGKTYKPVQNTEAFSFFHKFVEAGHMKMETAGSLCGGAYVWGLAKIGKSFELGRGKTPDRVESYLLLMSPHKLGKALICQQTSVRVVCRNTLTAALGAGLKGHDAFRMPHVREFDDDVKATAERALGLSTEKFDAFKASAQLLASAKATKDDVADYFLDVLRVQIDETDIEKVHRRSPVLGKLESALEQAPGAKLHGAIGTWWGAFNAVTYVVDHQLGRNRNTALLSAWTGGKANMKRRALDLAVARAS